jgi:hypothetical protein
MRLLFAAIGLLIIWLAEAQEFSSQLFHEGFLVTNNKDTLRGALKYDMQGNMINLIDQGKVRTFSSHKVFYFEIYDQNVENYRQFYSLPFKVNIGYKIPILFELQYEGPLSLLTREAIIQETVPSASTYWGGSFTRTRLIYYYYFIDKEGQITYYDGRRKELFGIMADKKKYVKEYIKEYKLQVDELKDVIRITAFYNSI